MALSTELRQALLTAQKTEITEHHVYLNLAKRIKDDHNRQVVEEIGEDEKRHYEIWKVYTLKDVKPNKFRVWLYTTISRVLGLTFGLKLMELGEERAQKNYERISESIPAATQVMEDEKIHENKLLNMLDEELSSMPGGGVGLERRPGGADRAWRAVPGLPEVENHRPFRLVTGSQRRFPWRLRIHSRPVPRRLRVPRAAAIYTGIA